VFGIVLAVPSTRELARALKVVEQHARRHHHICAAPTARPNTICAQQRRLHHALGHAKLADHLSVLFTRIPQRELHISLSRTVYVKRNQVDPLVAALRTQLARVTMYARTDSPFGCVN